MSATSTIYDIRLRYMMEDRASKGVRQLARDLKDSNREVNGLMNGLKQAAGAAVAFFGLRAAKKSLIDYNSDMEQARNTTAGLLEATTGASWEKSFGAANVIVAELQQRAKTTTANTAELVGFMREIVQPATAAGLKAKDLAEFTTQAVVAAKAFGDEEIAALDIQQALNGTLTQRDRFAKKLLQTIRMTTEEFNALDSPERLATLKKAFSGTAIQDLIANSQNTFMGVFSTFQDQLQIFFGQVGLPLFKQLTAEIKSWNTWIDSNADTMIVMADKFSKSIKSVFNLVKEVASFFADHADTLILVAKAWAGLKMGRLAGGLLGGGMEAGGGFLQKMGGGLLAAGFDKTGVRVASFGASMLNAVGSMGRFVPMIGLAAGALAGIVDWWNKEDPEKQKKRMDVEAALGRSAPISKELRDKQEFLKRDGFSGDSKLRQFSRSMAQERINALQGEQQEADKALYELAQKQGLLMDNLQVLLMPLTTDAANEYSEKLGMAGFEAQNLSVAFADLNKRIESGVFDPNSLLSSKEQALDLPAPQDTTSGKPKVNVTIQRIEVRSDDPDRFAFGLVESLRDYAKNPPQGKLAMREG